MVKFQEFVAASLVLAPVMLEGCEACNDEHRSRVGHREAVDALRCLRAQVASLSDAKPDQKALDTVDVCIVLAETLCENIACGEAAWLLTTWRTAFDLLAEEMANQKPHRKHKKLRVAA